jgi:hypothetical protein
VIVAALALALISVQIDAGECGSLWYALQRFSTLYVCKGTCSWAW